ncbi:zinc-dependent metalloprotease [Roseateles sp. LYH14W]|uniref:Zinc-dependent metalloprotease n=1 Tax=Pelomonas parva TaxID=3299032 RepID=A0ABW7F6G1_9BURK
MPIASAKTPERDRQQLNLWAREQDATQWLLDAAIVLRLSLSEGSQSLSMGQRGLLRQLLAPSRTQRLMAQEAQLGARAYRLEDLLADLRRSVFTELPGGAAIPAARRNLQRHYVDTLTARLSIANPLGQDDGQAGVRAELVELKGVVGAGAARGDRTRRAHLQGLADSIAKALDPRFAPSTNPAATLIRIGYQGDDSEAPHACWPGHEH